MSDRRNKPSFLEAWLDDIKEDVGRHGAKALVPWSLIFSVSVGSAATWLVPKDGFWDKPEISMVFFTAILTLNGLLLALSWSSFGKIYEIASRPAVAKFLRANNLLSGYIFYVDFIHYAQVIALSMSALALALCVIKEPSWYNSEVFSLHNLQNAAMALSIASSIYALKYALGAVKIMQDLVWYAADPKFDDAPGLTIHDGKGHKAH